MLTLRSVMIDLAILAGILAFGMIWTLPLDKKKKLVSIRPRYPHLDSRNFVTLYSPQQFVQDVYDSFLFQSFLCVINKTIHILA